MGIPAASLMPSTISQEMDELRIAFDGDAVLFSDEAEVIAKKDGKTQAILKAPYERHYSRSTCLFSKRDREGTNPT